MAYDCGTWLAKYLLCFFNFILFLAGSVVLGVGIWIAVDKNSFISFTKIIDNEEVQRKLRDLTYPEVIATASYILIAAGAFVFLVSMLGYCGALRESQCLLTCYGVFLVIILIMEITAGSIAAAYKKETEDKTRELLKESIKRYTTKDNPNAETIMWNYFMAELKCCGVDSYKDFEGSEWAIKTKNVVPEACCALSGKITEFIPVDALCTKTPLAAWQNGCYNEFKRWIDDHINIVMGVGIGLGLLQLLGIFLAFCLCRSIDGYIK
ncbi:tetraspanin-9 [Anabrus simplex]|uniref:tetraspanin-9 n=1 Tax=Anabrus simplex TaxID=316456 RepID=UPI0034DD431E